MTEPFEFGEPALADEHLQMMREQLRRFVAERVRPFGDSWEEQGITPTHLFRELGALGFLGMRHPVEWGGGGLGAIASVIFGEEIARGGYGGIAGGLAVHTDMSISHIAHRGTDAQKRRYLPGAFSGEKVGAICVTEPGGGSDVAAMRSRAQRTAGGWVLNGSKTFITNGVNADIYVVAARSDPHARGAKGISLFIIDKGAAGLKVARKLQKHGWHTSDTAELFFDDIELPSEALLGEEGKGFYYVMSGFQNERLILGAMCVGAGAGAIDVTLDYVRSRQAFGRSLWEQPVVRQKLATATAKLAAARALTYQCAQMVDEGKDPVREVSMLKAFSAETLQEVVQTCAQLHGGMGFMAGTAIERMLRDARVYTVGGGATEVMLEEVAKRM
jgi:acyl-CoA dehydrogenase